MLKSDNPQSRERPPRSRTRQRISTSCTECKRRKQKCNQAKDRPCNNCSRRYPPVACVYEGKSNPSMNRGTLLELDSIIKVEAGNSTGSAFSQCNDPYLPPYTDLTAIIPTCGLGSVPSTSITPFGSESPFSGLYGDRSRVSPGSLAPRNTIYHQPYRCPVCPAGHEDGIACSSYRQRDVRSPYFPYMENMEEWSHSYFDITKPVVDPIIEPLLHLPVEPSRRNAELYHLFVHRLSPYITSIDGKTPDVNFNRQYLPFMLQSPLNSNIPILTTAYFKAIAGGNDVEKSVDAVSARFKLISLVNDHLGDQSKGLTEDTLAAVMSMAYNDLIYTDKKTVMAHMKGLRSMLRARGGIQGVQMEVLRKLLLRTDYLVALVYECDPLLDFDNMNNFLHLDTYPIYLDNPLIQSKIRFVDSAPTLRISIETAQILDDMRFLTTTILSTPSSPAPSSPLASRKFFATASWIHKRLMAPLPPSSPLTTDYIHQSCLFASQIFSLAILTRTPFSLACTSDLLHKLSTAQWRVPFARWKQIPGVFFWMVLCSAPFARDLPMGRWHKGMIASSTLATGLVDWDVAMQTLRGFGGVQRWLRGGKDGDSGKERAVERPMDSEQVSEGGKAAKRAASV